MRSTNLLLATMVVISSSYVSAQLPASSGEDLSVADSYRIQSGVLNEERRINIWTPSDYNATSEVYPVLYLLDGDRKGNVMWGVSSMLRVMEQGKAPVMIVVGIDSKDFWRDYSPVATPNRPNSGQADNFRKYLVEELKPWVDANFRTAPYSVLCGSSNGGLFTVYCLLAGRGVFDAFIAPSPSIGWCADYMTALLDSAASAGRLEASVLYMNFATDDLSSIVLNADSAFFDRMKELRPESMVLKTEILPDAGHVPYISIHNGLRTVFPNWLLNEKTGHEHDISAVDSHYRSLSGKYGWEIAPPQGLLTDLFVRVFRAGKIPEANTIIDKFIDYYPASPRGYYFQSRILRREQKTEQERESLEKALRVDSNFVPARRALEELVNTEK